MSAGASDLTTAAGRKSVLVLEPDKRQQGLIRMAVGGAGVDLFLAGTIEEAQGFFSVRAPDLIFCDAGSFQFLFWTQQQSYLGEIVLIESGKIDFQRLAQLPFVLNVMTREPEDRGGTGRSILTSLTKIFHQDYFGIEKYLYWGTNVLEMPVEGSAAREPLREHVLDYFRSLGLRSSTLDRAQVAAEEMMMNAVYDAPQDAGGSPLYNHLPRATEVVLEASQQPLLRVGCDGSLLAISVQDPFGSLPRYVILKYLESCYENQAGALNEKKGGAGRGLHQILESCDGTVFNIHPGKRTEVIGLFYLDKKPSGFPQFHYFFLR